MAALVLTALVIITHDFAVLFSFLLRTTIRIQQNTSSVTMKAPTVAAIIMIIENDPLVLSPESSTKIELRSCNKCTWPIKACTYSIMITYDQINFINQITVNYMQYAA